MNKSHGPNRPNRYMEDPVRDAEDSERVRIEEVRRILNLRMALVSLPTAGLEITSLQNAILAACVAELSMKECIGARNAWLKHNNLEVDDDAGVDITIDGVSRNMCLDEYDFGTLRNVSESKNRYTLPAGKHSQSLFYLQSR